MNTSVRSMARITLLFFLLVGAHAGAAAAAANPEPGGHGQLQGSIGNNCFKPDSPVVVEVCSNWTINWKLFTLMGEPVGNYTLKWSMTSIRLNGPDGKSLGTGTYAPQNLPAELRSAASKIELYIDAYAAISGGIGAMRMHHFNTGVPVRAGADASFNVPGSPNWNRLLQVSRPGTENCKDIPASFVSAETAKDIFRAGGLGMAYAAICPGSGVSELTDITSAIAHLCDKPGASKRYTFCKQEEKDATPKPDAIDQAFSSLDKPPAKPSARPRQKTGADPANSIDGAFANMEADRAEEARAVAAAAKTKREADEHAALLRQRHETAVNFCTEAMRSAAACFKDRCGAEPEATICTDSRDTSASEFKRPENARPGESFLIIPHYVCFARGPNPKRPEWASCTNSAAGKCNASGTAYTSYASCVAQRDR